MPQNYIGSLIYQYKLQPWQPIKDGVDIMSMQTNFRQELFEIVFNNGTTALIKDLSFQYSYNTHDSSNGNCPNRKVPKQSVYFILIMHVPTWNITSKLKAPQNKMFLCNFAYCDKYKLEINE